MALTKVTYSMIEGSYVNALDYGAVGDDSTDCQSAFEAALTYCSDNGIALYIPSGTYRHSNVLTIDGVVVFGEGVSTILKSTSATDTAIKLIGTGSEIKDVFITSTAVAINSNVNSCGVAVYQATNFTVNNVTIDACPYFGIGVFASTQGKIIGNNVYGALKDGIHLTNDATTGSSYIEVSGNFVGANGDDGISVVTYNTATISSNINITNNTIKTSASRAINLSGAALVNVANNIIQSPVYAGIAVITDNTAGTLGCERITIDSNIIDTAGHAAPNLYGALHFSSTTAGQPVARVICSNNIVSNSRQSAVYTFGGEVFDIKFENNGFYTSGNDCFEMAGGYNFYITNNRIVGTVSSAVYTAAATLGEIIVSSNYMQNIGSNNSTNVLLIASTSPTIVEVSSNTHINTAAYTITRFLNITAVHAYVFNNHATASYVNGDIVPSPYPFYASYFAFNNSDVKWLSGAGSPEGVVTAAVGSMYSRTDGGAGTSLYVKESGSGNTGWVGK